MSTAEENEAFYEREAELLNELTSAKRMLRDARTALAVAYEQSEFDHKHSVERVGELLRELAQSKESLFRWRFWCLTLAALEAIQIAQLLVGGRFSG